METRRALVTGAASGIGAACARRLAADGVQVIAVDYDADGLAELAAPGIEPLRADLSDLDGLSKLPTDVDILVNNAGVQQIAPVEQFPPERFGYILRLMLESPFRLIRQTLPYMYGRGWGRVVNISSSTDSGPARSRRRTSLPSTGWRGSAKWSHSKVRPTGSPVTA